MSTATKNTPELAPPASPKQAGLEPSRMQAMQAFNTRMLCMNASQITAFQEVVHGARLVVGCDFCALFLYDPKSGDLLLKGADGYEGLPADLRISNQDPASIHAQAFNEEYLVSLDSQMELPDAQVLAPDIGSNLVIPVISNQGPVGVFDFASRETGAFTPEDIGMCSMLVDQMSYTLENIRLVGELSESRDAVIRGMALLSEIRDSHIGGHLNRICAMSAYLSGKLMNRPGYHAVTPGFVSTLERAAALHDVGKVGIPDAILLKPGKLTTAEFEVMKTHTTIGAELLDGLIRDFGAYDLITLGAEVAVAHHEWWDGSAGRDIPLSARIVALCDVYDALTSRRVYKESWSHQETLDTIKAQSGKQFDPELVKIFLSRPNDLLHIRKQFPE